MSLEELFPGLRPGTYLITSPVDEDYNCIAWAAGDAGRWWWPDAADLTYWPPGLPREESLDAFRAAFATLGYGPCGPDDAEPGFERVAVFCDEAGRPTHAARQMPDGRWTSKLGELVDIEHELSALAGAQYGTVALVLRRTPLTAPGR